MISRPNFTEGCIYSNMVNEINQLIRSFNIIIIKISKYLRNI
jgi:hypothetical protein